MNEDLLLKVAITKLPHLGAKTIKQLIAYCGSISAIFNEKKSTLLNIPGIGEKTVEIIHKCIPEELATDDLLYLKKNHIKTLFYLDNDYPRRLAQIDDAPVLIYYKGKVNWNKPRTISVVGTRRPTSHGRYMCEKLIDDLKEFDIQIVSGLAYGIDALAHQESLKHNIPNIAVMGTGIDVVYPADHKPMTGKIIQNGAILSEYPIRSRADKENFPRRNRIIAGISDATIVVQSAKRGGSLITAEFANIYHRDVFAFPGRTGDEFAEGCNRLIKQNKAHLIESAADVAYIMSWELDDIRDQTKVIQKEFFQEVTEDEKKVLTVLNHREEWPVDALHGQFTLTYSELASILLHLEFKGLITSLPGKRYCMRR